MPFLPPIGGIPMPPGGTAPPGMMPGGPGGMPAMMAALAAAKGGMPGGMPPPGMMPGGTAPPGMMPPVPPPPMPQTAQEKVREALRLLEEAREEDPKIAEQLSRGIDEIRSAGKKLREASPRSPQGPTSRDLAMPIRGNNL